MSIALSLCTLKVGHTCEITGWDSVTLVAGGDIADFRTTYINVQPLAGMPTFSVVQHFSSRPPTNRMRWAKCQDSCVIAATALQQSADVSCTHFCTLLFLYEYTSLANSARCALFSDVALCNWCLTHFFYLLFGHFYLHFLLTSF